MKAKYINAEKLKELLLRTEKEFIEKSNTNGYTTLEYQYKAEGLHLSLQYVESLQQEQSSLSDNLDEAAKEYDEAESWSYEALPHPRRAAFKAGACFAVQRIISLIESRIAEILGDAQPAPVLRAELRELIDKIKAESK